MLGPFLSMYLFSLYVNEVGNTTITFYKNFINTT